MACIHFQNALKLRKLEKYHEAGEELKLTNDPEGRVHLGYAYLYGGFGIDRDENKGIDILLQFKHPWAQAIYESYALIHNLPFRFELDLESNDPFVKSVGFFLKYNDTNINYSLNLALLACKQGNPFVISFLRFTMQISLQYYYKHLITFANDGDAISQHLLGGKTETFGTIDSYNWLNKSANQKCHLAYYNLASCMESMQHPDILKMARMFILSGNPEPIEIPMTDDLKFQYLYLYGQYGGPFCNKFLKNEAIDVYKHTTRKVRTATLYWMWISKKFVCKDVGKMIGKIIYNTRYKPLDWEKNK